MNKLREALRDALLFIEQLPTDLGRGSLNGFRVQVPHKIREALAEPAQQAAETVSDQQLWEAVKSALPVSYRMEMDSYRAQPAAQPVAYWNFNEGFSHCMIDALNEAAKQNPAALYTTPPRPEPLSDEQIWEIACAPGAEAYIGETMRDAFIRFARAIERAITAKDAP